MAKYLTLILAIKQSFSDNLTLISDNLAIYIAIKFKYSKSSAIFAPFKVVS